MFVYTKSLLASTLKTGSLMAMYASDIRGFVVIVMAPTGSGKSILIDHLLKTFPQVTQTVSCTTRQKRPQETEGVEYCFVTEEEFKNKILQGEFIEWATYGGNLYGTLKSELNERLRNGEVVICEVEIQGVLQLLRYIPERNRTVIFVDGGDWATLKARALARAPISEEELLLRHERYLEEIAHKGLADVIISNRDNELEEAKRNIEDIMRDIISTTT